jgi:hypothetical protein
MRWLFAALLLGCTPTPAEVCAHWASLRKAPEPDDEKKCVASLEGQQESDPHLYRCEAKCTVKARTADEAAICRSICRGPTR